MYLTQEVEVKASVGVKIATPKWRTGLMQPPVKLKAIATRMACVKPAARAGLFCVWTASNSFAPTYNNVSPFHQIKEKKRQKKCNSVTKCYYDTILLTKNVNNDTKVTRNSTKNPIPTPIEPLTIGTVLMRGIDKAPTTYIEKD